MNSVLVLFYLTKISQHAHPTTNQKLIQKAEQNNQIVLTDRPCCVVQLAKDLTSGSIILLHHSFIIDYVEYAGNLY